MRRTALTLLTLLLATPALAADGDFVRSYASGPWNVVEYLLCDGDKVDGTPPNNCANFDLHTGPAGVNSYPGLPHHITFAIRTDTCQTTANDFEIQANSRTSLTGLAAVTAGANRAGVLSWDAGSSGVSSFAMSVLSHRIVRAEQIVEGTGVCDDFEVVMIMFYPRVQ